MAPQSPITQAGLVMKNVSRTLSLSPSVTGFNPPPSVKSNDSEYLFSGRPTLSAEEAEWARITVQLSQADYYDVVDSSRDHPAILALTTPQHSVLSESFGSNE